MTMLLSDLKQRLRTICCRRERPVKQSRACDPSMSVKHGRVELNTFFMYIFSMTLGSCETILLLINMRTAWNAASTLPLTEQPS